jgi:hypothetical protein
LILPAWAVLLDSVVDVGLAVMADAYTCNLLTLGGRPGRGLQWHRLRQATLAGHAAAGTQASTERSRQLYLCHGFRDLDIWHGSFPLFLMWRPASSGPAADAGSGPAAGAEASSAGSGPSAGSASTAAAGRLAVVAAGDVPALKEGATAGASP